MTDFYVSPVPVSPPPAYWRCCWTDGKLDAKGKEVIHRGSPCSLSDMATISAWVESKEEQTMPEIGKTAYDAYCAAAGYKSLRSGEPLPTWEQQAENIRAAWAAAAEAVWKMGLEAGRAEDRTPGV